MVVFLRAATVLVLALACAGTSRAATPNEIKASIEKGCKFLKGQYKTPSVGIGGANEYGIGPVALVGLALLEGGTSVDDPSLKSITGWVRDASYAQHRTYQVSLCLMYLDRLGEPKDEPLIQMLAVRLLVGQNGNGGWTYDCCGPPGNDVQRLKAMKPNPQPGKLHPDIKDYWQSLVAARTQSTVNTFGDDNSNTQFAVIGVWMARKHGVPVDAALDLIDKRFLSTQIANTGGWGYSGAAMADVANPSPAMHCAGLIGLSTGVARREERLLAKNERPKKENPAKSNTKPNGPATPDDPFFNPPSKSEGGGEPKKSKKPVTRPVDGRDRAVKLAFAGLGAILAESAKVGRGGLYLGGQGHGRHDLYFFWSLERVGVIYGVEKIGGVDWYEAGAETLVRAQQPDGSWSLGGMGGSYGPDVNTAFAVLFLSRSNLARDLSGKVQKEVSTEMRAGAGASSTKPATGSNTSPGTVPGTNVVPGLPALSGSEAGILAAELLKASDREWPSVLKKLRDTKGTVFTQALVTSVYRLDGDRRREAREALAERLTRMTATTLRTMAKDEDGELRRAALLAMAMKDDKSHVRDLVGALLDNEEIVVRAAKAGLKSLTGQDFGPVANATIGEKKLAVAAWNDWLSKQKK